MFLMSLQPSSAEFEKGKFRANLLVAEMWKRGQPAIIYSFFYSVDQKAEMVSPTIMAETNLYIFMCQEIFFEINSAPLSPNICKSLLWEP